MVLRAWSPLEKGDIVDVVAPGFPTAPETVEAARKFLIFWGLRPRIPKGTLTKHFLHAADDDIRLELLSEALRATDSKAIWCLRGGYGANRLLPGLAKLKKPKHVKLFVGISDITSLHVFLQQKWGWKTLHGPLLDRLGLGKIEKNDENEVHDLVFGLRDSIEFAKLRGMNEAALKSKILKAPIHGGNLVTLQSTLGTPWQMDVRGKFLFLEELGERGYRIDRIFEHFKQTKALQGCRGVLLGDFLGGKENDGTNTGPEVIQRWAEELNIPVFAGLQAGHGDIQRPVPFGAMAVLRGGKMAKLTIESGVK